MWNLNGVVYLCKYKLCVCVCVCVCLNRVYLNSNDRLLGVVGGFKVYSEKLMCCLHGFLTVIQADEIPSPLYGLQPSLYLCYCL
jgi:hypothetical protein